MIPYGRHQIDQSDIDAVTEVLQSDFLTQGPQVPAFEAAVSKASGARHAIAVNSATSALHLACLALGLAPGDILWTSPITFVASANCALYCGATVDFVDIDPDTFNISAAALEAKLIAASASNRLPKVIVPVAMCGQSPDMKRISELARAYGVKVIEDASHAIGASYKSEPVGCGTYADITVFSFHPVKIVTSAEGGMAVTNDDQLAQRMQLLRSHGVTRDSNLMQGESHGPWYYQQVDLGLNYRMTELQAALGVSQIKRLPSFIADRQSRADWYDTTLSGLPIDLPGRQANTKSSWHLYVIRVAPEIRHDTFVALRQRGIGVNVHYIPVHLQPYFSKMGFAVGDFPEAETYYSRAISIPLYHGMGDIQQSDVSEALHSVLE